MRGGLLFPFLLGLSAGGVLVWALGAGDESEATTGRANAARVSKPALEHAAANAADPAAATADPGAPRVKMPPGVAASLAELERVDWRRDEEGSGLIAIAYLYSLAGRDDDFLRVVGAAMKNGTSADMVLGMFQQLPKSRLAPTLDRMLALYPSVEWDMETVAKLYFEADARDRGIAVLERGIIEIDDERSGFASRYVAADPERAAVFLTRFLNDTDWSGRHFSSIAEAFIEQEKPDLAHPFLQRALELMPGNNSALDMLSSLDPATARAYAETRVKKLPEDGEGWAKLAILRKKAGDTSGAFAAMQEALKHKTDEDLYWELYRIDAPRALPIIRKLVADSSDDEKIGMLGDIYLDYGMQTEALTAYERAHANDRTDSEWLRGILKIDAKRAVELLKDMVTDAPSDLSDEVIGAYANALKKTGQHAKAFEYYVEAMNRDGDDSEWLRGLAEIDPKRAIPILREHLAKDPKDRSRAGGLATALAKNGDVEEALRHFRQAVSKSSGRGWYVPMAELVPDEVIAAIRGKIQKNPSDDENWGVLGKVYEAIGRERDARAAFEKAKELDPDDSEWTNKLRDMNAR